MWEMIAGAKVTVVEKRSDYRRNVWFDLEPRPWSASLEKLGVPLYFSSLSLAFSFSFLELIYDSFSVPGEQNLGA